MKKANKKHNNLYDYSSVNYIDSETVIEIVCLEHGIFTSKPNNHIQGHGCPKCYGNDKKSTKSFIEESIKIHGNKYDYSSVDYINNKLEVKIKCSIHGIFNQRPDMHLQGQGCPVCNESRGEKTIKKILENNNIKFKTQKRFKDCKYIKPLPFDFYLVDKNICIEFDGIQHFEPRKRFGGEVELKNIRVRDSIKTEYCKNNNINLVRISYKENINDKLNFIF